MRFRTTIKLIIAIVAISAINSQSHCQKRDSLQYQVIFKDGKSNIEDNYMGNKSALTNIKRSLTQSKSDSIEKIIIKGYASPEGGITINEKLSQKRAEALKSYIENISPQIPSYKIKAFGEGVNWQGLYLLVKQDVNTPMRDSILWLIENVSPNVDYTTNSSLKKSIMDLGELPWKYMTSNFFPLLRVGASVTIQEYIKKDSIKHIATTTPIIIRDTVIYYPVVEEPATVALVEEEIVVRKPLFAIKSNLLYDAIGAWNIELEVPIGRRWSIMGEWLFPWWDWDESSPYSKRRCFQILNGNIEGRYWFGNRDRHVQLTGWFAGVYAGGGLYDLEWNRKGYQGEFVLSGISGGYAHTINKSKTLRLEYSLSVGYMRTRYRKYDGIYGTDNRWHSIRENSGYYTWVGPTKVSVSLVWMLNHKVKKGVTNEILF